MLYQLKQPLAKLGLQYWAMKGEAMSAEAMKEVQRLVMGAGLAERVY
jgi:hypothetical protein